MNSYMLYSYLPLGHFSQLNAILSVLTGGEVPVDLKVNKTPVWLTDLPHKHGYIAVSYIKVRGNDEPVYFKIPT